MNERDLKRFEGVLRKRRDEVAQQLHHLEEGYTAGKRDASGYGIHMAEMGSEEAELEKNMAFLQGEGNWLQLIDGALDKFERGVYGICESCANPIGKPRLMAKPFAQYCIECRRKQETGGQAAS